MRSYLLQDDDGNIQIASSISAGLDYPGVGPEHAYLHDSKRATYVSITDDEAMQALKELCREEGIIPAIESAHAIAYALKKAKTMNEYQIMVVNLSGRGDKDVHTIAEYFKEKQKRRIEKKNRKEKQRQKDSKSTVFSQGGQKT